EGSVLRKNLLLYCSISACRSTAQVRHANRGGKYSYFLSYGSPSLEEEVSVEWLSLVSSIKPLPRCRGDLNAHFHSLTTCSICDWRTQSLVLQLSSCTSTCSNPASQLHCSWGSQPEWP